ncbi:hypothetical protein ACFV2N_05870, partial [Streptomyces sp. NPDC059680]|uniref:hypothetical protein n=1 Tax=Streptomyces sp. NPDC059680 TaxID=3346904 RepID=UPI0036A28569
MRPVQLLAAQRNSGYATQCARRREGCQGVGDVGKRPGERLGGRPGERQRPAGGAHACSKGQLLVGDPSYVTNDAALVKNLTLNFKVVYA